MIRLDIQKELHGSEGKMLLDLKLEIGQGQLVTLYGPSGSGKTSTLRMLAGLLTPDQGSIEVAGESWFRTSGKNLKPQQRRVGYVFQDYALFPHMTVRENLTFAASSASDKSVGELIETMELGDLSSRKPDTLSGGQQQRVALARALVQRPKILLLDEPLSALDMKIRLKLQDYIQQIHRQFDLTTILVSHDIGEIHKLSDYVYELKDGRIAREGSPADLFVREKISGKFKFTGEVLSIEQQEVIFVVTVLIQNEVVKVVAQASEVAELKPGDKVLVASKAFNPYITKID